jgi:hypothetical protein
VGTASASAARALDEQERRVSSSDPIEAQIAQLQQQQAAQTNALRAALEGRWTGPDSLDGWVLALDPTIETSPQTPLYP